MCCRARAVPGADHGLAGIARHCGGEGEAQGQLQWAGQLRGREGVAEWVAVAALVQKSSALEKRADDLVTPPKIRKIDIFGLK